MALICNRHSFELAENVCCRCGLPFCHDCLVYPRGPKKPPFCVGCAISAAGVRSSARSQSNLSRREVKRRVREAKGMQQQAQAHTDSTAPAADDRSVEITSAASFDQGWAVSGDESRDPHPGYPEPVHVNWGTDPTRSPESGAPPATPSPTITPDPSVTATPPRPAFVAAADPKVAARPAVTPAGPGADEPDEPDIPRGLPRLQPMQLSRSHSPARPGGLPSVRPPIKQAPAETPRPKLSAAATAKGPKLAKGKAPVETTPLPTQEPRVYGGAPATRPDPEPTPPPSGRLRRKEHEPPADNRPNLGWLDDLLAADPEEGTRA
jgi:hypothetical protein